MTSSCFPCTRGRPPNEKTKPTPRKFQQEDSKNKSKRHKKNSTKFKKKMAKKFSKDVQKIFKRIPQDSKKRQVFVQTLVYIHFLRGGGGGDRGQDEPAYALAWYVTQDHDGTELSKSMMTAQVTVVAPGFCLVQGERGQGWFLGGRLRDGAGSYRAAPMVAPWSH